LKVPWARTDTAESAGIKRILVCDDERHIVRLIQVNLRRQGYEIVTAFTGREALDKLFTGGFDLAVVDTRLPDMTGREVLAAIRANPETAHLRVILLGDQEDRDDDELGPPPDMFLTKPINPIQLVGW